MWQRKLQETLAKLVDSERGILAADESIGTIGQRFKIQGIDNTEDRRREYRELLFSTPNVGRYLSGVIMFEETLEQTDANGTTLVDVVRTQGMVPGVKVDLGKGPLTGSPGDMISYRSEERRVGKECRARCWGDDRHTEEREKPLGADG